MGDAPSHYTNCIVVHCVTCGISPCHFCNHGPQSSILRCSLGTTSVQGRERKNSFPVPRRHQLKHSKFWIFFGTRGRRFESSLPGQFLFFTNSACPCSASPRLSNLGAACANTEQGVRLLCRVSLSDQLQVQEFVDGLRSHFRAGWCQCATHFVERDTETKGDKGTASLQ